MDDDASGLSLRMEAVTLSFRPLRVIVGLDYKAADAWFIEFRAAASQCMVRVDQPRARGRGAFSHAVSAHFSGGRGCFWGRGLAKHDCRADRTQLRRCGRVGQRVGCFSWSRSSCLCHSTLYRSCGAVIMSFTSMKHLEHAHHRCVAWPQPLAAIHALTRITFRPCAACAEWGAGRLIQEVPGGQRGAASKLG